MRDQPMKPSPFSKPARTRVEMLSIMSQGQPVVRDDEP
jgi:hypothetical protein